MKLCKHCKTELEDNQKFCYRCGSNEFKTVENMRSENNGEISVQSESENVIENPQSDVSKSSDGNHVVAVLDNNVVKKAKNKKKFVKIAVPIVAVIVLIVASLGIFSFVNYLNYRPYRELLEKLESNHFIYYQEYDEISSFEFTETDAGLNFFEKILNIRKVCEVRLTPHIYFLYDKDAVEDYEALYDLIAEEEDDEAYNDLPRYCELVIADNGGAKIVCDNETLFNVNLDKDKNIVSVTYEGKKEYKSAGKDKKLGDKYVSIVEEYADYLIRKDHAEQYLSVAQTAPLYFEGSKFTIADFITDRFYNDYEIEITAHRADENYCIVTVSGDCMIGMSGSYTETVKEIFLYNIEENECSLYHDDSGAFEWYYYSTIQNNYYW